MPQGFNFESITLPEGAEKLRQEVREFIESNLDSSYFRNSDFNSGASVEFSRKLGEKGWIGMTWPKAYRGGECSYLERYVVTEELVAAGAPVGAHWIADRQSGPQLLKFGTEEQRQEFLPAIASGECFFSIGMSEPDSGSDLASIRTSARQVEGGWLVNGTKIWTSGAHLNHFMITLLRTSPPSENRHAGMSQFIIDLKDPNVTITGIKNLSGDTDFNQVFFDDVFVPDSRVAGKVGNGWEQVVSELSYERSGPERFLSAFRVFVEFVNEVGSDPSESQKVLMGRLAAHLLTLRSLSISVAGMLGSGKMPDLEAALVKELGNNFEKLLPEMVRLVMPGKTSQKFTRTLNECLLHMPSFTLRGGTREILRGVIARGLGLR